MPMRPLLLLIVLYSAALRAQPVTDNGCSLQFSLLTCGPGSELYSMWGHTGIRMIDSSRGTDVVFNYGTFDDSDPYFYLKFTRGIMIYALSVQTFPDFMAEYQWEGRKVTEQVLSLTCQEKDSLARALINNAREENRFYDYHFHTDNCTTRARDMIFTHLRAKPETADILNGQAPSYRDLIHQYLDRGGLLWSKFGIDLLLGSNLDKKPGNQAAMFLPDYLMKGFSATTVQDSALVKREQEILHGRPAPVSSGWLNPMVFFSVLLAIVALFSAFSAPFSVRLMRVFDSFFFLILGLLGLVMLLLWIFRVDDVCGNNFNLLWALPTHLPVAFIMHQKRDWVKKYFRYVFSITLLLAVAWFFLPQQLNIAVAPILLIIIVRSYFRSR